MRYVSILGGGYSIHQGQRQGKLLEGGKVTPGVQGQHPLTEVKLILF